MTDPTPASATPIAGNISVFLQPTSVPAVTRNEDPYDINNILSFDKSDLVAIVTSDFEAAARSKVAALVKSAKATESALNKVKADITTALDAQIISTPHPTTLVTAGKALTDAGFPSEIRISGGFTPRTATDDWSPRSEGGSRTSNAETSIQIHACLSSSNSSSFTLYRNDPLPSQLTALLLDRDRLTRELETLNNDIIAARQELQNVASVERSARGALARTALQSTERGKAILENLKQVQPMALLPETAPAQRPLG